MLFSLQGLRQSLEHGFRGPLDLGSDSWVLPLINANGVILNKVYNLFLLSWDIVLLSGSLDHYEDEIK